MKFSKLIRKLSRAALAVAACLAIQVIAQPGDVPPGLLTTDHPNVKAVMAVQRDLTPDMMKLPGVLGTAVGLDDSGQTALVIYVDRDAPTRAEIIRGLPAQLRGVGLKVELTDKFRAYAGNTAKQTPPIKLGTSGGWSYDLANGYCCGGTLGSLIQVNGVQYIMSNYHVLEADIVSGGNNLVAAVGQPVIQPGLIDVSCNSANAQGVGTLVKLSSLPGSNVDVSVAQVTPGMVSSDGAIFSASAPSRRIP